MNRIAFAVIVAAALACAKPETRIVTAGEHRLEITVPQGWEALDQGRQTVLRNGENQIVLIDLGPARPEGIREEIERARELWTSGQEKEARTRLEDIHVRKAFFVSPEEWERFFAAWNGVELAPLETPVADIDARFSELRTVVDTIQPAPLHPIADSMLEYLDHDERRYEVKSRTPRSIDGREAMTIETWMALTHADMRRFVIIIDDGRVLALRHNRTDEKTMKAFDDIVSSLHFAGSGSR